MDHPSGTRVSRRTVVATAAAGAAAIATPVVQRASAQDKPYAGQKLVLSVPAYFDPYFPEGVIPGFEDKTGATVDFQTFPGGEEAVKFSSYLVAQDSSVDVLYGAETVVAQFGPVLLEDITGKVDQAIIDDIVPAANKAFQWNGVQYGLPFDSNLMVFMWNTDLYTAAGLDPDSPPKTLADFIEYTGKLKQGDTYGTIFELDIVGYSVLYNSTGGTLLSSDMKTINADSQESLTVLQGISDLWASGGVDPVSLEEPDSIETGKTFRTGRFGHYIAFPNHYRTAQDPTQSQVVGKAKTGLIPGLSLRSGTANGIEGLAINKFSKNKDLALEFLKHALDADTQTYVATTWGRPPASKAVLSDPKIDADWPQFATVLEQATYTANRYGSPFYADLNKLFQEQLLSLVKGEKSVADTAAALKDQGQKIIDDYWASVD